MIIRWKCKKCDQKWIYPVPKCIHCGGEIERQIGKKGKVVGVTKVSIPSVSHPMIPYYVLMLEDENGNKMPKKVMKEFQIGDSYELKQSNDEHAVALIKNKYDLDYSVELALSLLPDLKVDATTKIFLKPSMMTMMNSYMGMTTNPEVLEGVINYLIKQGAKPENMIMGETVQFGDFDKATAKSGLLSIAKKFNIDFINLAKSEFIEKKSGGFTFSVAKEIYDYDLLVNVPVMKTHMLLGIAGALENMTRVISADNVKELMTKDINDAIYNLFEILPKKQITIGDASIGLQGNGPLVYGEPAFLNKVLASYDPVAIDKIFQEMCLLRKSPHVEHAGEEGLGENELMHIPVVGDDLDACRIELKQPIGSKLIKKFM